VTAPALPAWLTFGPRAAPSANLALIAGTAPVLVDAAEGQEPALARTEAFLREHAAGAPPALVLCTHFHPDHVGAVAWLQHAHGTQVAAHATEAALVAAADPRACDATWLAQPVAPYTVDRALEPGEVVAVPGGPELVVVPAPGQTPGHVAFHAPDDGVVFTGDLLQAGDVAWLPLDGPWAAGALEAAIASVERIGALGARVAVPGHGPLVTDVAAAVERTLARYASWREDRERWAWHGARRLVAAQVALRPPRSRAALTAHLERVPAVTGMAAALGTTPAAIAARALTDLLGSGAIRTQGGRIAPGFPHEPPGPWRLSPRWG
jgi:glyoxylase-like metal-dependent hydrolase (beta-lactamase superfamily II)